jgi:hypothetical protein
MTTREPATGLLDAFAAVEGGQHPHLNPINRATLAADRDQILEKAGDLLAYQRYLADARAVKAKRKGASASFERSVLAQARRAQQDLDTFIGSALRMAQQLNQTNLWRDTISRATQTLGQTGPTSLQATWSELIDSERNRAALADHGLSADMAAAITDAIGNIAATASVRDGKLFVETQLPGEDQPRRAAVTAGADTGPAGDLSQLLRRSRFDAVAAALSNGVPVYLDALPVGGQIPDYHPPDLFAVGLVAARQRMTEHVRKLEDTGLATYEGSEPGTLTVGIVLGLLIAGVVVGGLGTFILELCGSDLDAVPPDWMCAIGEVLVYIALLMLLFVALIAGSVAGAFVLGVVGWMAFLPLWLEFVENYKRVIPDFHPGRPPV